jgi:hypothetical protein
MDYHFPDEVLAHIISFVDSVPIDTRLAFGVLPKRLIIEEQIKSKLDKMCLRRTALHERKKERKDLLLLHDFVSTQLSYQDFCLDFREYNGSMGYRIIKMPNKLYFAVSMVDAVDFPCNRRYISGPYSFHTGSLLD